MHAVLVRVQGADEESWLRSVIVDFDTGRELVILLPKTGIAESEPAAKPPPPSGEVPSAIGDEDDFLDEPLFGKGTKLEVEIAFPDGIRRFESVVRRLDASFGGSLRIAWPTEGTRVQRRDYVRVDVAKPIVVRMQNAETGAIEKVVGATIDLSAGGTRLNLAEPIPDDTRIELEFNFGGVNGQLLQGRVVRSGALETKRDKPKAYWVAVEFVGVGESLRKDMTQLVFDLQREQMRRSLS